LGSLEPDVIEPYLSKNLHWRVQKVFFFCLFLLYFVNVRSSLFICLISRTEMWWNLSLLK
jgi:hypothetical protein